MPKISIATMQSGANQRLRIAILPIVTTGVSVVPLFGLVKTNLVTEGINGLSRTFTLPYAHQSGQQPFGIGGRTQQMDGFEEARQLISRNQGSILLPATLNNHHLAVVAHSIKEGCEMHTGLGVGRLNGHLASRTNVQGYRTTWA